MTRSRPAGQQPKPKKTLSIRYGIFLNRTVAQVVLTKFYSGFFAKHETRENAPEFLKPSQVSQDQIFGTFVFRESYNFRETREIRLIKQNGTCQGFTKIRRNRELPDYLQSSQYIESLLFYEMFIIIAGHC
jgi:hypothetical protein